MPSPGPQVKARWAWRAQQISNEAEPSKDGWFEAHLGADLLILGCSVADCCWCLCSCYIATKSKKYRFFAGVVEQPIMSPKSIRQDMPKVATVSSHL